MMATPDPAAGPASAGGLPPLRAIPVATLRADDAPVLRIKTDDDVDAWKQTRGYQDYGLFLRRLAESVVGRTLPHDVPSPDQVRIPCLPLTCSCYCYCNIRIQKSCCVWRSSS